METILQGSCSEAVLRIDLSNLSNREIKKLEELLENLSNEEEHEEWYDTTWSKETIFEKSVITIKGETPYNYNEWLMAELSKLKFWSKVKYEDGEY